MIKNSQHRAATPGRALRAAVVPALCLLGLAAARQGLQAAPSARYAIANLGVIQGGVESEAIALNEAGQVAGLSVDGSDKTRAFLFKNPGLQPLGALAGAVNTVPFDISPSAARVVGAGQDADGVSVVPFAWLNGTYTKLPYLEGGTLGEARATNGTVTVGSSENEDGDSHAVRWTAAGVEDLGTLPDGFGSAALGVNAAGDSVGWSENAEGWRHATLWSGGTVRDLGTLPGDVESRAVGINANWQIAGTSERLVVISPEETEIRGRAFLWQNNVMTALPGLGGDESVATAINASGVVVGAAELANGEDWHACMWVNGQVTDLNTLLPANSGWVLEEANDINDAGEICGAGTQSNKVRGYVLAPLPTAPAAPSGLTATALSGSSIKVEWQDNSSDEKGFELERSLSATGRFTKVGGTLPAGTQVFTDTGLTAGTEYFYRVAAVNDGGRSDVAGPVSATTLAPPPAKPTNLTSTAKSSSSIELSFKDGANNEDGFRIFRKKDGDATFTQLEQTIPASAGVNKVAKFTDTGLTAGTKYFYHVRAFHASGQSDASNEANATTQPNPPAAPSDLTLTVLSDSSIKVEWVDRSSDETGFKVLRRKGATGVFTHVGGVLAAGTQSYTDARLTELTQYFYQVVAVNAGGDSAPAGPVDATTLATPPAKPIGLKAAAKSTTSIDLEWTDKSGDEDGFRIFRKKDGDATFTQLEQTIPASAGVNKVVKFTDTGLTASTKYFYLVRAVKGTTQSDASNEVNATTKAPAPVLGVALSADTSVVRTATLTLTLTNSGDAAATNVVATVNLPAPTAWVFSSASDGGTLSGKVVTFNVGTIAAGATVTRTVVVTNQAGGTANFTGSVQATGVPKKTTPPVAVSVRR